MSNEASEYDADTAVEAEVMGAVRRQIHERRVAEKLALLAELGDTDPYEDGTVVKFEKVWGDELGYSHRYRYAVWGDELGYSHRYRYAAIRVNDRWYVTGRLYNNKKSFTWDEFRLWLVSDIPTTTLVRMVPESAATVVPWIPE